VTFRRVRQAILSKGFYRGGLFHCTKNYSSYLKKIDEEGARNRILNIGSGGYDYFKKSINVDPYRVKPGDIQGFGEALPFKDEAFDFVVICAVLEHVPEPRVVINEIHRVLRKGGRLYAEVPFLQPFHSAPHDYNRVTLSGLQKLFYQFEPLDFGVCVGPGSCVTWVLVEYVQIFFSRPILKKLARYSTQIILFPLKYLDRLLIQKKEAHIIASGFYFLGIKKADT